MLKVLTKNDMNYTAQRDALRHVFKGNFSFFIQSMSARLSYIEQERPYKDDASFFEQYLRTLSIAQLKDVKKISFKLKRLTINGVLLNLKRALLSSDIDIWLEFLFQNPSVSNFYYLHRFFLEGLIGGYDLFHHADLLCPSNQLGLYRKKILPPFAIDAVKFKEDRDVVEKDQPCDLNPPFDIGFDDEGLDTPPKKRRV